MRSGSFRMHLDTHDLSKPPFALALLALACLCPASSVEAGPHAGAQPEVQVPDVDRSAMQPQVARVLEEARLRVRDQPTSADAWGRYGSLLDAHMLAESAAACYRRARELDAQDIRWAYLLGTVVEAMDDSTEETLAPFKAAARINPNYAPVYHRMGEVLSRRGRLTEAVAAYERALAIDDSLAITHRSLGQVLVMLDQPADALPHLRRADELTPDDRSIVASLAQVHQRLGEHTQAQTCSRRSRDCKERVALPDAIKFEVRAMNISLEACRERALRAAEHGDVAAAIQSLAPCRDVRTDDPYFHYLLGLTYSQIQLHELAVSHLQRALSLKVEFASASMALATAYLALGRVADAEAPLRAAISANAQESTARARLGTVLARTGRSAEAILEFEAAAADRDLDDVAHFDWANALIQTGAADQAMVHYRIALERNPRHADAHYNLGVLLERSGDRAEALRHFQAAVEITPQHRAAQRLAALAATAPAPAPAEQ